MELHHQRYLCAAAVAFAVVSVGGCSRPLDESRAKALIETSVDKIYFASIDRLVPLMSPSTTDYSAGSAGGAAAIIRQLIANGLVTQTATETTYPNPSGSWAFDESQYGGTVIESYRLELQISPGSNAITGSGEHWKHGSGVGSAGSIGYNDRPYRGTVTGTVTQDGTVTLETDGDIFNCCGRRASFQYSQNGETAFLRSDRLSYTGTARPRITLKRYEYAFTPKLEISPSGVAAGQIEIRSVSDLLLTVDTRATAHFGWTVTLNDVGRILLAGDVPGGTGTAEFAKKPDGTWILAERPRF